MSDHPLVLQAFDRTDPKNMGRPSYFDLNMYIAVIEQMITCDEVERALWMMDNLPGWYRSNKPFEIEVLKKQLLMRFATTIDYVNGETGSLNNYEPNLDLIKSVHRGQVILDLVTRLGCPHLVEMSPCTFFVPHGLKSHGLKFSYESLGLNKEENETSWEQEFKSQAPSVFISFEVIEHLHKPEDIYHCYLKTKTEFDYICLSTPLYTWKGGHGDWYNRDLGHLRTYTPSEFGEFAVKYWPEFKWELSLSDEMVLVGTRKSRV